MIHYVLCTGISGESGRRLANAITEAQGDKCYYINRNRILHPQRRHVRYGNMRTTSDNCLNRLAAVENAADKLAALGILQLAGVPVPPHVTLDAHQAMVPYRRVFRRSERRAANDNPYLVNANEPADMARVAEYDYGMEFVSAAAEYRVHVFRGTAIIFQIKQPQQAAAAEEIDPDIRSSTKGWVPVTIDNPFDDDSLAAPAIAATQALGLDFGAVDIIHGQNGQFYVLEVNTAAGINPDKAALYAGLIHQWDLANPEPEEDQ